MPRLYKLAKRPAPTFPRDCLKHLKKVFFTSYRVYLKSNERVGWTEDTLDCCRKILQPPNVVKFMFLCNSRYLTYLDNKDHKVQITDFGFISNVFIASDGQDRY